MKINNIASYNFKRALTTQELQSYKRLINDAQKQLNIQDTTAIVFDFNTPQKKGENTSIGTTFSNEAQNFAQFLKTMFNITSIQLEPQGKISLFNTSPYSGTNFSFGEHIIDLKKLEDSGLLKKGYVRNLDNNYPFDKIQREYKTNYEYILPKQKEALIEAYYTFKKGDFSKLKEEFETFKKENYATLESESLFEILAEKYQTENFDLWEETDKNLYNPKFDQSKRSQRIEQLKEENKERIDFINFIQFIASKQQKEARKEFSNKGIKLYGDCLIGFSQSEIWANPDCFLKGQYYGGPDPNCPDGIQTWGLAALDYTKIGDFDKENISSLNCTGKLLYKKYSEFFKRYDGVRMDAAWQFVVPFVYYKNNGKYSQVELPELNYKILDIVKKAAKDTLKDNYNPDNIMLELVGTSADKSREMTKNIYPHLYTTAYSQYDERPEKFLQKGYRQGKFYTGTGCHDNDSLVNMAKNEEQRRIQKQGFEEDFKLDLNDFEYKNNQQYQNQNTEEKERENFRNAKFSEIFTSQKQFFTLVDIFGMEERINISGKPSSDNWSVRIPSNYEEFYFSQCAKGYGLNLPKALSGAFKMKKMNNGFIYSKLNELADILRQKGPNTTKEADMAYNRGELGNLFEYRA